MNNLIILGLTGPVGSGCSSLSKLFDDDIGNTERDIKKCELLKILSEENYIDTNSANLINYKKYDDIISHLFKQLETIEKEIESIKSKKNSELCGAVDGTIDVLELTEKTSEISHLRNTKWLLFNELKKKLEDRELLKALVWMKYFIKDKKHLFTRISISDLIIFNTLWRDQSDLKSDVIFNEPIDRYFEILSKYNKNITSLNKEAQLINKKVKNIKEINKLLNEANKNETNNVTKLLRNIIALIRKIKKDFSKVDNYRQILQDFGDNIRRSQNPFDYTTPLTPDYFKKGKHLVLAKNVESMINFLNKSREYSFFIIESFRNPYESQYLREKYPGFYLISINAKIENRKKRVKEISDKLEERDQGKDISSPEDGIYMQNVPKVVKQADIAINNDEEHQEDWKKHLAHKVLRYIALIIDTGCTKPTDNEIMMNLAYTMAMKSNCISRQVGAVIVGKDGYVIGAGWNDVGEGKISCGLREINDLEINSIWFKGYKEDRVLKNEIAKDLVESYKSNSKLGKEDIERFCFCFKDQMSIKYINEKFIKHVKLSEKDMTNTINQISSKIKRLEYCEALHAEENAIIQSAKIGGIGLKDGTIYVTAFPCELCAKKIQQVGIKKIVYTEPYPGNISEQIFLKHVGKKIQTEQFEGVMPYSYIKLFKVIEDQKDWQDLLSRGFV